MYATDFEYDGHTLSDFGFMICDFNASSGTDTFSAGSEITFNTISRQYGKSYGLIGTTYDSCISATFRICKNPDTNDSMEITNDECRDIVRWLNRREFCPFMLLYAEDVDRNVWYEASFNINKITINKKLYGLELTMTTNRPFGYGQALTYDWNITDVTQTYLIPDMSDEIGYLYPKIKITMRESGDFVLKNPDADCTVSIKNCTVGEVIEMSGDSMVITSSLNGHEIYNDFNYDYFRIANSYNNRSNYISVNLMCDIVITYNPLIKDSPV